MAGGDQQGRVRYRQRGWGPGVTRDPFLNDRHNVQASWPKGCCPTQAPREMKLMPPAWAKCPWAWLSPPLPHSTPAPPNTELPAHTHTCMIRERLSCHTPLSSCPAPDHWHLPSLPVTLLSLLRDTVEKAVQIIGIDTCRLFC